MLESSQAAEASLLRHGAHFKHFPYAIHMNLGGRVPIPDANEALGAFLGRFGFSSSDIIDERYVDEAYEFTYRGRLWRATFVLVYDHDTRKEVCFRIDLDYIRRID